MSAYQRTKGANGERELVNLLKQMLPEYEWQRLAPLQTSNKKVPDVGGTHKETNKDFPFHIEVKKGKATIQSALKQARENCASNKTPLAITRRDHAEWIVSMSLETFVELVKEKNKETIILFTKEKSK